MSGVNTTFASSRGGLPHPPTRPWGHVAEEDSAGWVVWGKRLWAPSAGQSGAGALRHSFWLWGGNLTVRWGRVLAPRDEQLVPAGWASLSYF